MGGSVTLKTQTSKPKLRRTQTANRCHWVYAQAKGVQIQA
jgi:hypothetical protein